MNIKTLLSWTLLLSVALWARGIASQSALAPVDISAFGNNHPLQATVTHSSSSACKAVSLRDGALHHYDITLSGMVIFENHSQRAVLLYKDFSILNVRVALSSKELVSGRFVSGFDGDRMAISSKPKDVSISDFTVVAPGKSYVSPFSTTLSLPADPKSGPSEEFWVQVGIDTRPDEFYFDPGSEKSFARRWRNQGQLVEFILTKPFPLQITVDPSAPICK